MSTSTQLKTIPFDQLMKVMKKFVATSEARPVLTFVSFDGTHFTATNSHILLRVNAEHVTDIPRTEPFLYNVKENKIDAQFKFSNYPETSRLIPQNLTGESNVYLNKNLKEFHSAVKDAKKLLSRKDGHLKLEFTQNDLTINTFEKIREYEGKKLVKTWHKELNEQTINSVNVEGKDIALHVNHKYLDIAMESVKKLSIPNHDHVSLNMMGAMRPLHFMQYRVFDLLLLPIRIY